MAKVYKHCVVGHGLTGTAACKYLAELGEDTILVGPSEGNGAHGACYDEGRIYRILDPREPWALLAERSIQQYGEISKESNIDFFTESGMLIFGVESSDFIQQSREAAAKMKTPLDELRVADIEEKYPFLRVPAASEAQVGLLQTSNAGHLSPRKMCHAQLVLATQAGATYVDSAVEGITRESPDGPFCVSCSGADAVRAENVLVAAGVYTSLVPELLPRAVSMALTGAQALLAEISEETAGRLAGMPSLIYEATAIEDNVYILPPIQYPDGAWLIKVGPSDSYNPPLATVDEVEAWFRSGQLDPDFEAKALRILEEMFVDLEVLSWRALVCVTDNTPTQNAYIDRLEPGWGICTGGNGWAAKSADAIGCLAAQMMSRPDHWSPDPAFRREWFRAVTPHDLLPTPQMETALAHVAACGEVMACRAVEALAVVTQALAASPRLHRQPHALAECTRRQLEDIWGAPPSVLCAYGAMAWAPSHPFITIRTSGLTIVVLLTG